MCRGAIAFVVAFALLAATPAFAYTPGDKTRLDYEDILAEYSVDYSVPAYLTYLDSHPQHRPSGQISIDAAGFASYTEGGVPTLPATLTDFEGQSGVSVLTAEDAVIEYEVDITQAGLYEINMRYYPAEGKSAEIQRAFFVNGELPYRELACVEFPRIWHNEAVAEAKAAGKTEPEWARDNQGNDLKPIMLECPEWIDSYLYDSDGYITKRLSLYFDAGRHTLTIVSLREPMLIGGITLTNGAQAKPYEQYLAEHIAAGAKDASQRVVIQAQNAVKTSSQMLYPRQDQSSPTVSPSSARYLLNNTIGGGGWRTSGQWIEWEFHAPEDGLYSITAHALQNFSRGVYVSRKITVDGEVPFAEFEDYGFVYRQNWRAEALGGEGGQYKIYLTQGAHILRFEAVLGSLSEVIGAVRDSVSDLNRIYRKVIRLTGVAPDRNRSYQINRSLPELKGEMVAVRDRLQWALDALLETSDRRSDRERVIKTMITHLDELIHDPERFARTITSFRQNIRACGTWLTQALEQPLQLDTITLHPPGERVRPSGGNFFSRMWFELSRLFFSFVIDYNQVGNVAKGDAEAITLWIGSGRDQAGVIKSLIDESFTKEENINVNVMLVDMGTLLQATLAGQGPDVAIQVTNDLPMNYGLRKAVTDLTQFSDLREVLARFRPSIMTPYSYDGAVYALPETETFPMMFYRKDILKELGLGLPQTWDDVKVSLAVLANNQMDLGMLPAEPIYAMLLFQNGGEYYNENATRSLLDNDEGYLAFKLYTELYTDYRLDRETSVEERFRTGEAPIIIQDYTFYNILQVSAPEIKGLWGFGPVPATARPDGTLDRTVGSYGSACVIMSASKVKDNAWQFLKWWTSADTQTRFGREMESLMGAAARHPSANVEAFDRLPWPVTDYNALSAQFAQVRGIPQVPGGYFSFRNINNAFYASVIGRSVIGSNEIVFEFPREALTDKVLLINEEIDFKRREFGLPLYGEEVGQ